MMVLGGDGGATRGWPPAFAARVRDAAAAALERLGGLGAAVALRVDGTAVLEAGLGWRDTGRRVPISAEALLNTYSISKALFAVVAMRLAKEGRLALDEPIPGGPAQATPRRLLNHTAGVPDYGMLPGYHEAVRTRPGWAWTGCEFLDRTVGACGFGPAGPFAYSNTGYLLLRRVLEGAGGMPMPGLLRRHVWGPLKLERSCLAEGWADVGGLAPGWTGLWGGMQDAAQRYDPAWVAMRSVLATAGEVAAVFDALMGGRLVDAAGLAAMLAPVIVPGTDWLAREKGYGLGLMVDRLAPGGVMAGHGGGGPGYSSGVLTGRVDGRLVTAAALANTDGPDLGRRMAAAMMDAVREEAGWTG